MWLLGIDVGTGGTRVLIVDERGKIVAAATQGHAPVSSPQIGFAEQDPKDWWQATTAAVRRALADAGGVSSQVGCVGFSGQMHGAVLLDQKGQTVRPAIIWSDLRTSEECREITRTLGRERLLRLTCNPALENFTLTKLLWVRKHEPGNWKQVRAILLPKDYVRFCLTGDRGMDVADASGTLMLDVAKRAWSEDVLRALDLDSALLPPLYESPQICGQVSRAGAEATGLQQGTPVVAGAGDQAAGAVGLGVVRPGAVSATIGTSGVVFAATDLPKLDPNGRLHTFCHALPNRWHVMGVTQAAGLSLRWFRDQFGAGADDGREAYERLTDDAAACPPASEGLLWAPYLMGERTPHLDPHARAMLVGLTASHKRSHIIRAVMEGVAFSLKDSLTIFAEIGVPVRAIRLGGGGARSQLWRQIQADVYGMPVEIVEAEEGAAYGAAILAGVGIGTWPSVENACDETVRVATVVEPDATSMPTMAAAYQRYRQLYPAFRSIFRGGKIESQAGLQSELRDAQPRA